MPDRYPGYDVMDKRDSLSWNDATRRAVSARLALPRTPRFFSAAEWELVVPLCDRIVPQPIGRTPIPTAVLLDDRLHRNETEGYRRPQLPPMQQAWRRGLAALAAEAEAAYRMAFPRLAPEQQDALLARMQKGEMSQPEWDGIPPAMMFSERIAHDIVEAYFSHPTAWSEVGWGGPASPRGYVRMGFNRRDAWEPEELQGGDVVRVTEANRRVR